MIKAIENESCIFFYSFSASDPIFPLVKCFRDNVEISIFKEKSNYSFLHICSLLFRLFSQIFIYLLWAIAWCNKFIPEPLSIPLGFISLKHNITLSIYNLS